LQYFKKNCKPYCIRVNTTTEKDIYDKIKVQPNKIGFIKEAIRAYKAK
jgi:hypothetical protein